MIKRKPAEELKIARRDDTTPKPRRVATKKKAEQVERITALAVTPGRNDSTVHNPDRPLTEKQRLFVKYWATGETILSASVRAGYADGGSIAYKLAKDPAILKLLHEEQRLYQEAAQITRKDVIEGIKEGIDMARMLGEPATMIGGWREIGKICGHYEPAKKEIQINVKGDVTMKHMNRMSDDMLLKLIKGEVTDVEFKELEEDGDDD